MFCHSMAVGPGGEVYALTEGKVRERDGRLSSWDGIYLGVLADPLAMVRRPRGEVVPTWIRLDTGVAGIRNAQEPSIAVAADGTVYALYHASVLRPDKCEGCTDLGVFFVRARAVPAEEGLLVSLVSLWWVAIPVAVALFIVLFWRRRRRADGTSSRNRGRTR